MQCFDAILPPHSSGGFTDVVIEPAVNVTILTGSSISLVCSVNFTSSWYGSDRLCSSCVVWAHNDTEYSNRSNVSVNGCAVVNSLPLTSINVSNSGFYECKAYNETSTTLHISVTGESIIHVVKINYHKFFSILTLISPFVTVLYKINT